MVSDAIYNVTHGTVNPWKHATMCLGFTYLTGSKLTIQILSKTGHCISNTQPKGLEIEFVYSFEGDERDTSDGIHLIQT